MRCDNIMMVGAMNTYIIFLMKGKGAGLFIIKGNEYGGRVLPNLSPS